MRKNTIEVDAEVFAELQRRAEPLVDTANSVLRKVLGLAAASDGTPAARSPPSQRAAVPRKAKRTGRKKSTRSSRQKKRSRAPKGALLPDTQYELPILRALNEYGGSAAMKHVLARLETMLEGDLRDLDREKISSGDIRWRNRAQFVRLKLVRSGHMKSDAPRGVWEISQKGRARLKKERA